MTVLLYNLEGSYIKLNSHFAKPIKVGLIIRGANKRHHWIINFILYSNTSHKNYNADIYSIFTLNHTVLKFYKFTNNTQKL